LPRRLLDDAMPRARRGKPFGDPVKRLSLPCLPSPQPVAPEDPPCRA